MKAHTTSTPADTENAKAMPERLFQHDVRVLLSDTDPKGVLRLDALARLLHDAATLDIEDSGLHKETIWVLRSIEISIFEKAHYLDKLSLVTFCSGTGRSWAERSTNIYKNGTKIMEAKSIWVNVGGVRQSAKSLPDSFFMTYGKSVRHMEISARQVLKSPKRNPDFSEQIQLRFSDLDVMDHVNNAVHLALIEDVLSRAKVRTYSYPHALRTEFKEALEIKPRSVVVNLWLLSDDKIQIELVQNAVRSRTLIELTSDILPTLTDEASKVAHATLVG